MRERKLPVPTFVGNTTQETERSSLWPVSIKTSKTDRIILQPIRVGTSNTFNYLNVDKADAYGVEAEFRKKLDFVSALRNFTLGGNVARIWNRVTDEATNIDRPMQGQSPYTVNLSLQYDTEKSDGLPQYCST
ncbi:TonB-dependent receptor [Chryseobacterium arthrosphaerae]|uniref:TonB-dependent receptor n=1 Tax=Chryseobacterium arthrosphaerae TaxID=651561 RepID=A0A432DZ85_9FLAO|nr:TonB-dependent receptor [Chryseobacterium arthrosphaerae]